MTTEEAIKVLEQIRQWTDYPKEALTMAIEALSRLSLPTNIEEASERIIRGMCPIMTNGEYYFIRKQLFDVCIAGAEWMAGQGVTKDAVIGMATKDIDINVSGRVLDKLELGPGDKVIVQIRKK